MDIATIKSILATSVSICTILQFLSGVLICKKIIDRRVTGDISPTSFICGFLSTSLWLRYGFLISNSNVVYVNLVGSSLFFIYCLVYLYYSLYKFMVLRQILATTAIIILAYLYTVWKENDPDVRAQFGILCCVVTVIFFGSPLLSALHVIRTKNTNSLPYPMIVANFVVATQWYVYGILLGDQFIQIPNFLGSVLTAFQLSLFCLYPSKLQSKLESV